MVDEQGQDEEPTSAEVVAHMAHVAGRVAAAIAEAAPEELREAARAAALGVLEDDEGARTLLAAAYDEGVRESARRVVLAGGGAERAPDWSDVESVGERRALAREEAICGRCTRSPVCVVARSAPPELLVVVSRCGAFLDR